MARAFLVGFGNVGSSLAELLLFHSDMIGSLEVSGVSNSKGSLVIEGPEDKAYLAKIIKYNEKLESHPSFKPGMDPVEAAVVSNSDLAFITIPPSYETGEPNRRIYYGLINENISIITADKTMLALEFNKILDNIMKKCLFIGYRATVAAGTPVIDVVKGVRLRNVKRIRAVLNASTNYILGLVEKGMTFRDAVNEAIAHRLAEPDPKIDIDGWDPAAKLVIIANILNHRISLENVVRKSLTSISEDEVLNALKKGMRMKYIALADLEKRDFRVEPLAVNRNDPLASAEGEDNVVVIELEDTSIVIKGPAGPAWRTARVMLTDLADYLNELGKLRYCGCG